MPRKKLQEAKPRRVARAAGTYSRNESPDAVLEPEIVENPLDEANVAVDEAARAKKLALQPYTDCLPYRRDQVIAECRALNAQMGSCGFELGKRLIALRENEPATDWKLICEDVGISVRWAYTLMELARRFAELPRIRESIGSVKKLLALTVSEKELEEAERTGTVLGKPLSELDRMTEREVREHFRKHEERIAVAKKQVDELRGRNLELEDRVRKLEEGLREDGEINKRINEASKKFDALVAGLEIVDLCGASPLTKRRFLELLNTMTGVAETLAESFRARWVDDADEDVVQVTSGANYPGANA